MSNRRALFDSQQHRKSIGRRARQSDAVELFNVLTGPELLQLTDAHLPEHRERLYSPTVTLSMFMRQALDEDGSCQKVVNDWAARRVVKRVDGSGISMPDTAQNQACYPRPGSQAEGVGFPLARIVAVIRLSRGG